jgi:hypothetical protein
MRTALVSLLVLVGLSAPMSLAEQTALTKLRVEVKTYTDRPIERASVIIRFVRGKNVTKVAKHANTTWELKTNQEGVAKLPPLPQGELLLQVIAKGYQTYGKVIEVNEAERTIEVKLNAPQPQESAHK